MSIEEGYVMAFEDSGTEAVHRVKLLEKSSGSLKILIISTGEVEEISPDEYFPIDNQAEQGVPDLSDLTNFNEVGLLVTLTKRFSKQSIYTHMNSTLIIINPFQHLPDLFSQKTTNQYIHSDVKTLPPHIFTTARSAYLEMCDKSANQVILISGESGAGKTETTKHVINFLTKLTPETSHEIENKILSCSPILEAFGNAKTVRNDNSSRFGKFVKLYYDPTKTQIKSASIESFLLEKTRVVRHESGERNYHVFYLLCKYAPRDLLTSLGLARSGSVDMQSFNYIRGDLTAGTVNDQQCYQELVQAFAVNSFTHAEVNCIWQVLAAILCLGNVDFDQTHFDENTPCKVTAGSQEYLDNTARLLEVSPEEIYNSIAFITRKFENQDIKTALNKEVCESKRDTMAKHLYDRLFAWVLRKLNLGMNGREGTFIGILDIYGFEVFKTNSFEQFCINYANEKLQQLANDYIFKSEQDELRKEGLDEYIDNISYVDNQEILNLLEAHPLGIFRLIDESCSLKSDDRNLLYSLYNKHKGNELLVVPKIITDNFMIKHTASDVLYTATGFVSKNMDEIRPEIMACVNSSSNKLIKNIMKSEQKDGKFLGEKFRKEINLLMTEIRTCNCFFVRCLKPNDTKSPWTLMPRIILKQIQYLGLLDTIMIRKKGYPVRLGYRQFFRRYECLNPISTKHSGEFPEGTNWRGVSQVLCESLLCMFSNNEMILGNSKVFLKYSAENTIEVLRNEKLRESNTAARIIQGWIRARRKYWDFRKVVNNIPRIQAAWRGKQQRDKFKSDVAKVVKLQKWFKSILYKDQIALREFGLQIFYQYLKIKIEDSFLEKCFKLAITAQKMWRGHKSRKLLKAKRLVSNIFNSRIYRPCWNTIMQESTLTAVVTIQRCYRGYDCRKKKAPQITQIIAANRLRRMSVSVQRLFRGEIVRKKISRIRSAALRIQGFWKAKKTRSYFLKLSWAVVRIQRALRAYYIRSKLINRRLEEFTSKELALLKNLTTLEHSELFSSHRGSSTPHMQESLKTLSAIAENTASLSHNQLISTGSLGIQCRQVSPFHIEKMYFFARPLELEVISDESVVYEPLWSKQFEMLNLEVISKEEQIMDIAVGNCHTLAVTSRGKVFAWGWNDKYQCGTSGNRPRLVEGLKDHKIVQLSCGDDHNLVLTSNGEVLGFGDNTRGQLGQGTYSDLRAVVSLEIPPCKQVVAVGNQNMAVTQNGELYIWPFETIHGEKRSYPMKMLYDHVISEVSVGYNFAMILATSGILLSLGSNNRNGQLGHGDFSPRSAPTVVLALKKIGEKISNVSCGYRHVVAKSNLGKLYTWGCGINGELGHGPFQNEATPRIVCLKNERTKAVQISAGYRHTVIMMENKKLLWTGTNSQIRCGSFTEANIEGRFPEFFATTGEFCVLKVHSIWSRILNCVLITIADLRYIQNATAKLQTGLSMIAARWINGSIEPPLVETISGYFPTSLCGKKGPQRQPVQKVNRAPKHPLEEMKEKISEILKKPSDKWTLEDKYTMEHISKLNH